MKKRYYVFFTIVFLYAADRYAANKADEIIRSNDAFFFQNYNVDDIDWNGSSRQGYVTNEVLYAYSYRTYLNISRPSNGEVNSATLRYLKPLPVLSFFRLVGWEEDYLNGEFGWSRILRIYQDGVIQYVNNDGSIK